MTRLEVDVPVAGYTDLVESLGQGGCPICRLVARDATRFMDSLLYENVLDLEIMARFRGRRGLCNTHGWQLTTFPGQQLGVALLFQAALHEVMGQMGPSSNPMTRNLSGRFLGRMDGRGPALADNLDPQAPCMVCEKIEETEDRYLKTLVEQLGDARVHTAFLASEGLCLPHFREALRFATASDQFDRLRDTQMGIWERLMGEVKELVRKNDYRFAHEPRGPEMDSWRRVVARMVGEKGVFGDDR